MRMVPSRLDTRFEHCRARLAPNGCCRCHYRWATFERPTLLEAVADVDEPLNGVALLLNANTAGGFQSGEASLVGVDSDGASCAIDGWQFFWNGERVRVVASQAVDGNDATKKLTLLTNEADRFGYMAIDIADRGVLRRLRMAI